MHSSSYMNLIQYNEDPLKYVPFSRGDNGCISLKLKLQGD